MSPTSPSYDGEHPNMTYAGFPVTATDISTADQNCEGGNTSDSQDASRSDTPPQDSHQPDSPSESSPSSENELHSPVAASHSLQSTDDVQKEVGIDPVEDSNPVPKDAPQQESKEPQTAKPDKESLESPETDSDDTEGDSQALLSTTDDEEDSQESLSTADEQQDSQESPSSTAAVPSSSALTGNTTPLIDMILPPQDIDAGQQQLLLAVDNVQTTKLSADFWTSEDNTAAFATSNVKLAYKIRPYSAPITGVNGSITFYCAPNGLSTVQPAFSTRCDSLLEQRCLFIKLLSDRASTLSLGGHSISLPEISSNVVATSLNFVRGKNLVIMIPGDTASDEDKTTVLEYCHLALILGCQPLMNAVMHALCYWIFRDPKTWMDHGKNVALVAEVGLLPANPASILLLETYRAVIPKLVESDWKGGMPCAKRVVEKICSFEKTRAAMFWTPDQREARIKAPPPIYKPPHKKPKNLRTAGGYGEYMAAAGNLRR